MSDVSGLEEEEEENEFPLGQYEGERDSQNRRSGTGRMLFTNGDYYEGCYHKNLRHGKGVYVFTSRNGARYNGEFRFGLKSGQGTFYYPDGTRYEGEWKRNNPHGCGTYYYVNGDTYTGAWFKGQRHGIGTYTYTALGVKTICVWDKNEIAGGGRIEYPMSGVSYHGFFEKHRPVGKGVFVFPRLTCMMLGVYEHSTPASTLGEEEGVEELEEETSEPVALEAPSIWFAKDIVAYDESLMPPLPEPRHLPDTPDLESVQSANLVSENSDEEAGAWSEREELSEEEQLSIADNFIKREMDILSSGSQNNEEDNVKEA